VIRAIEISIHLGAEEAARDRVIGIACDANRASVANGDEHGARVGAVVRAGAPDDDIGWWLGRAKGRVHVQRYMAMPGRCKQLASAAARSLWTRGTQAIAG
jgi:hypothetical protein